jgi:hypothetical protein
MLAIKSFQNFIATPCTHAEETSSREFKGNVYCEI